MPIDLGGVFSRLPDPLGLFSGQGNNGVGTGAKSHPVFGDHGPPHGPGRDAGPGQGPGLGRGPGANAGGPQPGGPALQLPPAPPVPTIHNPASPVAVANQVVQHATQTLGGLPSGPAQGPQGGAQSMATPASMPTAATGAFPTAAPGTPAFTGGPGQPALPALAGQVQGLATSVASLPGQVVSQLARAMNHALPQGQVPANPQGQAFTGAHAQAGHAHSAAHRATETPVMPRQQPGFPVPAARGNAVPAHAGVPHAAVAGAALAGRPGVAATHAQPAVPNQPATQAPTSQALAGNALAEARSAPLAAHVPGRAAQPAPGNPAAQQPAQAATQAPARPAPAVPGNPAAQHASSAAQQAPAGNPAANAASQAATAATQAQVAASLAIALAGSTAVEARPVQPGSAERGPLHLESPHAAGHTAERGVRRGLRNRIDGVRKSLLQMLGLSQLDAAMRRRPDGHTAMGGSPHAAKGMWFALPWLFWLLAVVAYGCLALALIVMVGPAASGAPSSGGGGWVMPLVLALGVLAGAGAWLMARAGRRRRSRR